MSPVEVRALGQFVNLKKVQEKCVRFFQEVSSRFTSDECWKGANSGVDNFLQLGGPNFNHLTTN